MPRVQFLGTGNAFAPHGRMHALALIDGCILIDAPPTLLPQLRQQGRRCVDENATIDQGECVHSAVRCEGVARAEELHARHESRMRAS